MSTGIQWTDDTWNPTTGCSRVSEGCRHCYIERSPPFRMAGRKLGDPVQLHPERLDQPVRWQKPRRIFVNSLSDLFHDEVPDHYLDRVFDVMESSGSEWHEGQGCWTPKPWHTFQVLTKRPQRMRAYLMARYARKQAYADQFKTCPTPEMRDSPAARWARQAAAPSFRRNIWLGVSIENQQTAEERIPILLQTPAAVRFVSAEPLLGPVDITAGLYSCDGDCTQPTHPIDPILDWVIAGGESGPGARPCDLAWIRSIVEQCKAAAVPCFVKQLGAKPYRMWETRMGGMSGAQMYDEPEELLLGDRKGGDPAEWPADLRVREWPTCKPTEGR